MDRPDEAVRRDDIAERDMQNERPGDVRGVGGTTAGPTRPGTGGDVTANDEDVRRDDPSRTGGGATGVDRGAKRD